MDEEWKRNEKDGGIEMKKKHFMKESNLIMKSILREDKIWDTM